MFWKKNQNNSAVEKRISKLEDALFFSFADTIKDIENSINQTDVGYINNRLNIHDNEIIDLQKDLKRLSNLVKTLESWEGKKEILKAALEDAFELYGEGDEGNLFAAYHELKNAIEKFLGK